MVKKDQVQISVQVDGKQGINELGKLEMEAKDLRATLKDLKKGTEEYNEANNQLKNATAELGRLREQMGLAGMSMQQLTSYQKELQREWNNLTKGTTEYAKVDTELKKVNDTINQQKSELKGTAGVWGFLKSEIGKFGILAAAALGFDAIIGKITDLINSSAKLSDALADVQMTTGLSTQAVNDYNSALSTLNTRTSRTDLLGIGKIAGQFGVVKDELVDFTTAMNKTAVVLGSEFSGGAEQITERMATLRNVFTDIKSNNISDDITKISNAVVTLAQEGVATAPTVTDFANRIAGVGINLGLSTPQVLGLSATMQELGITAERGGTAVGKILQKMTTNTEDFATIAGMKLKDFSNLVDTNIYGAFLKVLEGSKSSGEAATTLGRLIKDLELNGAGASEVFSKLGENMVLLDNRTKLAGDAIQETSNITEQYNLKNENFAANMERIQKVINGFFSNSNVLSLLQSFVGWMVKLTETKASEEIEKEQYALNNLVGAITFSNDKYGVRSKLIKDLQEQYPDFLGNLNAETVTNEQLQLKLAEVNKEYTNKIFLARKSEDWKKIIDDEITATQGLITATKDLASLNSRKNQTTFVTGQIAGTKSAIAGFEAELNNLRAKKATFEKEQADLAKAMGINTSPTNTGPNMFAGENPDDWETSKTKTKQTGPTEEQLKAAEKQKKANEKAMEQLRKHLSDMDEVLQQNEVKRELTSLEKRDKELADIDNNYSQKALKAYQFNQKAQEDDNLTKEQKKNAEIAFNLDIQTLEEQRIAMINAKKEEWEKADNIKKEEAKEKIRLALLSDQDREIEEIKVKYETLITEAEKFGLDTISIYERMYDAIDLAKKKQLTKEQKDADKSVNIERKKLEAQIQLNRTFASGTLDVMGAIAEATDENTQFSKFATLAQIAIDTGAAISAASANSEKNPANAVTAGVAGALQFAAALIRIIAASSNAKKTADVTVPEKPSPKTKGFYYGGETGDENGKFNGYTHANEYVVPSFIRSNPAVINAVAVTEAVRQNAMGSSLKNYATNSSMSTNDSNQLGSKSNENQDMLMLTSKMVEYMERMEKVAKAPVTFYANEYERFTEEQKLITFQNKK